MTSQGQTPAGGQVCALLAPPLLLHWDASRKTNLCPPSWGLKRGRQRDGYFEVQRKQSRVLALEGRRQQDKEERGQRGGGVHRPPLPLLPIALLSPRLQKLSPVFPAPAQDWQLTPTVPVLLTLLSPQVIPGSQLHHLLFHFMTTLDGLTLAIDSQCPAPLSITFNF